MEAIDKYTIDPAKSLAIVPNCKLLAIGSLKVGDQFQYNGQEKDSWYTVTKTDEEKVYYQLNGAFSEQSNWRLSSTVFVWVKQDLNQ